jgi:hypothetical protein
LIINFLSNKFQNSNVYRENLISNKNFSLIRGNLSTIETFQGLFADLKINLGEFFLNLFDEFFDVFIAADVYLIKPRLQRTDQDLVVLFSEHLGPVQIFECMVDCILDLGLEAFNHLGIVVRFGLVFVGWGLFVWF